MVWSFLRALSGRTPVGGRRVALCLAAIACLGSCPSSSRCEAFRDPVDLVKRSIKAMERQDSLLTDYRYKKAVVTEYLDRDLDVKKKEERLLEVTSVPRAPDVEVVISINGKPLSEKEIEKSERERRRGRSGRSIRPTLNGEDLLTQFDWSFAGSDRVSGRPATVLSFRPKPGAVYKGSDSNAEKLLKKGSGRVWIDDEEFVITRVEFEFSGEMKSMAGLLWTLRSLRVKEERKRLDDGVWIDSEGEYFIDATALLVKSVVRHLTSHTYGYEKPRS